MEAPRPTLKKDWVLDDAAFAALLTRLDSSRDRAALEYEHIRRALITYFECRGSATPEDHADTTINRVARRLQEGKEIHVESPLRYFYGVARNVLKESWDASAQRPVSIEHVASAALPSVDPHRALEESREQRLREHRLDCLQRCLEDLSPEHRELITAYYDGDAAVKIRNRKRQAARLGIPLNALRIRALRVREKLEACVARRLGHRGNP